MPVRITLGSSAPLETLTCRSRSIRLPAPSSTDRACNARVLAELESAPLTRRIDHDCEPAASRGEAAHSLPSPGVIVPVAGT